MIDLKILMTRDRATEFAGINYNDQETVSLFQVALFPLYLENG